ncbi:MAG TPA: hypothetical protein VFW85_10815 [Gaiellaceae bacterium]|nr:hypothetical protein [Gaiellaceae bacterium]
MSGDPHEVDLEVLITVKAYPTPSTKYSESVCVAGLRLDTPTPEWIRLYPVRYRDLPRRRQFEKYDIVRLRGRHRTGDSRPESFAPNEDTIEIVGHLSAKHGWSERVPLVEAVRIGSLCELMRRQKIDGTSLGVFRPAEITKLEITPTSPEWDQKRQTALGQTNLFCEEQRRPLEKIPFDFHFGFRCDDPACGGHRISMIDWEIGENFRKSLKPGRTLEERLELVHDRWLNVVCGERRDVSFFAGSVARRPQQFLLLGAFWPPKIEVPAQQALALFP